MGAAQCLTIKQFAYKGLNISHQILEPTGPYHPNK